MVSPTIHMNGTSRESLMAGYRAAYDAIGTAIDLLAKTAPHGRDYYVQDSNAINVAIAEHRTRMMQLEVAKAEIETIILAIMD